MAYGNLLKINVFLLTIGVMQVYDAYVEKG